MDKDRRVSIETISAQFDVSVGIIHTIIRKELKMRKICAKFVPRLLKRRSERKMSWQLGDCRGDQIQIPQFLMLWWSAMKAGSTAMTQRPRDRVPSGSMLVLPDARRPTEQTLITPFFHCTGMIYMQRVPTGQTVNKEYYVEVLREFRKWFRRKKPALFKSAQWHFPTRQCTSHRLLRKMASRTVLTVPILQICSLWLLVIPKLKENLRCCRYETIEEMKEAVTKVIDTLTHDDFHELSRSSLERYNKCIAARRDYLEEDYSFMCVLSIKVPIRKTSGELFNESCICDKTLHHWKFSNQKYKSWAKHKKLHIFIYIHCIFYYRGRLRVMITVEEM